MEGVVVRRLEIYEVGEHWAGCAFLSRAEAPFSNEMRYRPREFVGQPHPDEESNLEFISSGALSDVAALVQPARPGSFPAR